MERPDGPSATSSESTQGESRAIRKRKRTPSPRACRAERGKRKAVGCAEGFGESQIKHADRKRESRDRGERINRRTHLGPCVSMLEKETRVDFSKNGETFQDLDGDTIRDEAGGMRLFPSIHVQTSKLLAESGLKTIALPLDDTHSLFHNCGHTVRKKDVKIFTTEGIFYGKRVDDIANAAKQRFEAIHGKVKDPYLNEELINNSVREYFKKYGGANDAEVDFWMKYSGYNLYDNDVQASIFVDHGALYGSDIKDHVFVSKGFSMLASWLLDGISIGFNHTVNHIVRNGDIIEVTCSLSVEPFHRKFLCSTLFISLSVTIRLKFESLQCSSLILSIESLY